MKFFLISAVILVVIYITGRVLANSMTTGEKFTVTVTGKYPKRLRVMSGLLALSFIETVVSLIVWIVNM